MYHWARTQPGMDEHWICDQCKSVNDGEYKDESDAIQHVTETGHTVAKVLTYSYMIYALRSEVFPEAPRG